MESMTLKTKVMRINTALDAPLTIAGETSLGSVISRDGNAQKDIKNRLSKAMNAIANQRSVWWSSVYNIRTKLHLTTVSLNRYCCTDRSVVKLLKRIFKIEAFHRG